jgi:diamine N-acetyltransferase
LHSSVLAALDEVSKPWIADNPPVVTLRKVTADNVRAVCDLELAPGQERFVAPAATSIAEAHYEPTSWLRAIYADDEPVGLVLLSLDTDKPEYAVWRLQVAAGHQRKGYGEQAMKQVIEHVRTLPNAVELLLSYVPGPGDPSGFYKRIGFEETDRVEHGERLMRLTL